MESSQASGQLPKKGEQQAQLDVTCLCLAKGKKKKDPPTGNQDASGIKPIQQGGLCSDISGESARGSDLLAHMAADKGEQMGKSLGGTGGFL
ncbi:hypothetical protein DUI87_11210 [Hirundo rustica rustica]|uniref:Uncharacterized protein n=1 Tax=Hirundo rustica rustica TaxID=333673 RepID=A0A3M0KGA0_HIRRU|nr:hypothetical protein DUI87_11210 [Hirundo rustica rustica]